MAPKGAPEVPKWSPTMSKWRHQALQMATPRSQRGPAAEGVALKVILLNFGPIAFRFAHGKNRIPLIFMISGFLGVSMTPKTNYVHLWRHQDTLANPRKSKIIFENTIFISPNISQIENFDFLEKMDTGKSCRSVFKILDHLEYRTYIFQNT